MAIQEERNPFRLHRNEDRTPPMQRPGGVTDLRAALMEAQRDSLPGFGGAREPASSPSTSSSTSSSSTLRLATPATQSGTRTPFSPGYQQSSGQTR